MKALDCLGIGAVITTIGFCAAFLTGGNIVGRVLYWQGYALQDFIPAPNLGTADNPLYEATPVHITAFFMGIPVGIMIYSLLVYGAWKLNSGKRS